MVLLCLTKGEQQVNEMLSSTPMTAVNYTNITNSLMILMLMYEQGFFFFFF